MRASVPWIVAAVLPAVFACENPDAHACASAFYYNSASAYAFCGTYMAGTTASLPALFTSACGSGSSSLSKNCNCFVTVDASASATSAASVHTVPSASASATPSTRATTRASSEPSAVYSAAVVVSASNSIPEATASSTVISTASYKGSSTASPSASTAATPVPTKATAVKAASGIGGSSISSLKGGSGVGGSTCTVTELSQVTASLGSCSNVLMSDVSIPASSTLSVTVSSDAALLFGGTMTVGHTSDTEYTPIVFKGTGAKIAGVEGAVIDGNGASYWDGEGSNGGSEKPDHFIKISDMEDSTFSDLTIRNWPTHLFEITGCSNMEMYNLILDNSAGDEENSDGDALGHNTDAFDVSHNDGLYVHDATVYNQDDCVAVNSGSNMVFENLYCSGGHGLSVGSVDSDVTISNVTFQDCTVINSANGCRIKTDADGTDSTVSDIVYSNIHVSGITDYAIDLQQDYENGSPTGDPTTGITVSGVTFSDITGSVDSDDAYAHYILCGSTESCSDITFAGIDISGGNTKCSPSSLCSSL
ncbi:endo-polygalacturonase D [Hortaea werneckii]|nr:endo-polygalacturonase D [Hortaea werneckii]